MGGGEGVHNKGGGEEEFIIKLQVSHAVSLAQDGLFGKPCNVLVSEGIAPNCDEIWNLLVSKHPTNDCQSVCLP